MNRLSPTLPFVEDETAMSWAARLAAFHTGGPVAPFLNDFGIVLADARPFLTPGHIDRLCAAAGNNADPVHANNPFSLGHVEGVGKQAYRLGSEVFSPSFKVAAGLRFCPACLIEDSDPALPLGSARRHRLTWTFAPVRTCPVHHIPLKYKATEARYNRHPTLREIVSESDHCLCRMSSISPSRQPSALQNYVINRLNGACGPTWLDGQSIEQAWRSTEYLGAALIDRSRKADSLSEDDWDEAGRLGWTIASRGAAAISEAVEGLLVSGGAKDAVQPRYRAAFGLLHKWLAPHRPVKDPGPIADIVRTKVLENFSVHPGEELYGKVVEDPPLTSISTLAHHARIASTKLQRRLLDRGLITEAEATLSCASTAVDWRLAGFVVEEMIWGAPPAKVADDLDVSESLVNALVDCGVLGVVGSDGATSPDGTCWVDVRDVHRIEAAISKLPTRAEDFPWEYFTVETTPRNGGSDPKLVVQAILDNRLKSAFRRQGYRGLGGVYFRPKEALRLLPDDPIGCPR